MVEVRIFVWCMICSLLFVGFKCCYEKDAIDAGCMIAFAMMYVGLKLGYWEAKRLQQGQN